MCFHLFTVLDLRLTPSSFLLWGPPSVQDVPVAQLYLYHSCCLNTVLRFVTCCCCCCCAAADFIYISPGKPVGLQAWQASLAHSNTYSLVTLAVWTHSFFLWSPERERDGGAMQNGRDRPNKHAIPSPGSSESVKLASYHKSEKARNIRGTFLFPLRASCYFSASGAERWKTSVLRLRDLTQNMYTLAGEACYRKDWQKHFDEIRQVKEAAAMVDPADGCAGRAVCRVWSI